MKRWLICGPFQASSADEQSENQEAGKLAFAFDFLKQHGGEAKIQPSVDLTHERDGREYQWRLFRSEGNFVNLSEIYGAKEWHLVAYAWAEIQMSARTTVLMGIGSNDALKIRLNGEIIHENWGTRRVTQDYYVVPVELRQGKNQLLIKVQYTSPGHWGFMCRPVSAESAGRALIPAANDGRKSTVEALLSTDLNINIRNVHGQTPLHRAAYGGHRSIAELLIEKGADVNARSIDNLTPFHLARRAGYMDLRIL